MTTTKKLLIGLAVLAVSVMGMQAEEKCEVCRKDPYGLSDKCWDVRLDGELRLEFQLNWKEDLLFKDVDANKFSEDDALYMFHNGARVQWSTNSIDWNLFNHCRGVGIQPNLSSFTFSRNLSFSKGERVDLHYIGNINWEKHIYEGPTVTKFFVRLLPCDVNAHKEAYKNRKIGIKTKMDPLNLKRLYNPTQANRWNDYYNARGWDVYIASGLSIQVEWNYGRLQFSKSLSPNEVKWENAGKVTNGVTGTRGSIRVSPQGYHLYDDDPRFDRNDGHYRYGFGAFFRIKPMNEDALKKFYIDLNEGFVRAEPPVRETPSITIENNRKAQ